MKLKIKKDESIVALLDELGLEQRDWSIRDYWEADLCAIGIVSNSTPQNLVYISTYDKAAG